MSEAWALCGYRTLASPPVTPDVVVSDHDQLALTQTPCLFELHVCHATSIRGWVHLRAECFGPSHHHAPLTPHSSVQVCHDWQLQKLVSLV